MRDIGRTNTEHLIAIVQDLHWMARRYADGRMSYVTGLFNDHVDALIAMGIQLNPTGDGAIYAQDGMGRGFDGLDDSQARLARISAAETRLAEMFAQYIERHNHAVPDYLLHAYQEWKNARGFTEETGHDSAGGV